RPRRGCGSRHSIWAGYRRAAISCKRARRHQTETRRGYRRRTRRLPPPAGSRCSCLLTSVDYRSDPVREGQGGGWRWDRSRRQVGERVDRHPGQVDLEVEVRPRGVPGTSLVTDDGVLVDLDAVTDGPAREVT